MGGKLRPGLDSVTAQSGVTAQTASELRELQAAVSEVQQRYLLLAEFRAVLSFLLETGTNPKQQGMMALRGRLLRALNERLASARRTVRFVLRHEPDVVRQVGNGYYQAGGRHSRRAPSSQAVDEARR